MKCQWAVVVKPITDHHACIRAPRSVAFRALKRFVREGLSCEMSNAELGLRAVI